MYAKVKLQQQMYKGSWSKKLFTFSCTLNDLNKEDMLIADSQVGYIVVKFEEYTDKPYEGAVCMPIICKVDISGYMLKQENIGLFLKE